MVELGVAYQGCMHPHHLEPDLREIAAMGCSYINMTVNECDWSAWEPFVALSSLDTFSTDPYWIHERTFSYFEDNAREAIALAHAAGKRCQIWVQAVWIAPGKEPQVGRTLRAAADLGADMLAVWSFHGEPGASKLDWGGDAVAAWQQVQDAYAAIAAASTRESAC